MRLGDLSPDLLSRPCLVLGGRGLASPDPALPCSTGDAATSEHSLSRVTMALPVRLSPCTAAAWYASFSLGYLIRSSPTPWGLRQAALPAALTELLELKIIL